MALLRGLVIVAALALAAGTSMAHRMGVAVPVVFCGGLETRLAANVVAAYFGEQMGREFTILEKETQAECLGAVISLQAPMALSQFQFPGSPPEGVRRVGDGLEAGGRVLVLVLGDQAADRLDFSLVPLYMEKLAAGLAPGDWEEGLAMLRSGAGARKTALKMLRKRDLL